MSGFGLGLRLTQQTVKRWFEALSPGRQSRCNRKEIGIMQTRLFFSILVSLVTLASGVFAQDGAELAPTGITQEDIVGPLPPVQGSIACFKFVDEPNFCVLPDKPHIINYSIPFNVIDLNGAWVGQSGERPYIYVYNDPAASAGYTIAAEMYLLNRPDGIGFFINGSTLSVYFPDDNNYTGTIEGNGRTIRWSNNTVWNKL
jgi:hypothetical protein